MMAHSFLLCVLVLLDVVAVSQAWFFFRSYPTAKAKTQVDAKCSELAVKGDCGFYSCFERRLTCGRNWYNVKYGEPYCRDFRAFQKTFSEKAQRFINDSQVCMGRELLEWYQRDSLNCHDFTHEAFRAMSRCYIHSGFCDVIIKDAVNFLSIYQPQHLFQRGALKIWREILRITYHCDPDSIKEIIQTLFESMKD
ncbi:uncharacterized protein LOC101850623 [Aplysia californica]|uniref:Uncharacterized protein LOC101850623 n=1 Tax=Aplysia californica TaxID=6500 RepID=A0ABM0JDN6_APLCA|nr:uncharacterized protein LOC101850623 [Aplysia californica]